ncbi:sialidase family protein [Paenibacillus flagellatus]|uniref:Sialidase domain-containing protein n=1 Tax=Paenibacillus flagellatus TaxID=2211139 RepID=A0A2V5KVN8_9BACL|nr:sialidase family protein [Paenibacillus flagellatus]PYI56187.1 hypothetical protein DLM86_04145 [Paenibacillus flagellatus]
MERLIAIDNVCAWPNLTMMPDGSIAAVVFNKPYHGFGEGHPECWISRDGGYGWERAGAPVRNDPGCNRMNVAAGLAGDGALTVISSGWRLKQVPGEERPTFDQVLDPVVCRSSDGGASWQVGGTVEKPEGATGIVPFGDIVRLEDGVFGVSMYTCGEKGVTGESKFSSYFLRSYDGGRSWVEPVPIGELSSEAPNNNETTVLSIDGRRLLAAARTTGDLHVELYASDDGGRSWTGKGPVTLPLQHPANFLRLRDGRILLSFGIRCRGYFGVGARISKDDGESWGAPIFLVDYEAVADGGYPSSVELDDGTIVTAYYSHKVPHHHRYHMGVVRWKAD